MEEFPFNQGKLCPKGVKRYLQGAHPDRLLHAYSAIHLRRRLSSPWHTTQAIDRVAAEIERIQSQHGHACLRRVSAARA